MIMWLENFINNYLNYDFLFPSPGAPQVMAFNPFSFSSNTFKDLSISMSLFFPSSLARNDWTSVRCFFASSYKISW